VDSLDEGSLTDIRVKGDSVAFTVKSEDGTAHDFTANFQSLPGRATLECTSSSIRGLAKANGKLAASATLPKAIAAAGRCVAVDLDWVCEVEGDGEVTVLQF
jgi:hypothetical protein